MGFARFMASGLGCGRRSKIGARSVGGRCCAPLSQREPLAMLETLQ
jgi:hypothetical protein